MVRISYSIASLGIAATYRSRTVYGFLQSMLLWYLLPALPTRSNSMALGAVGGSFFVLHCCSAATEHVLGYFLHAAAWCCFAGNFDVAGPLMKGGVCSYAVFLAWNGRTAVYGRHAHCFLFAVGAHHDVVVVACVCMFFRQVADTRLRNRPVLVVGHYEG